MENNIQTNLSPTLPLKATKLLVSLFPLDRKRPTNPGPIENDLKEVWKLKQISLMCVIVCIHKRAKLLDVENKLWDVHFALNTCVCVCMLDWSKMQCLLLFVLLRKTQYKLPILYMKVFLIHTAILNVVFIHGQYPYCSDDGCLRTLIAKCSFQQILFDDGRTVNGTAHINE